MIGGAILPALFWFTLDAGMSLPVIMIVLGAAPTALMGGLQWLALRRYVSRVAWWIAATAVILGGWPMISLITIPMSSSVPDTPALEFVAYFAGIGAILGAAAGLMQWLVLRRKVSWASWWLRISIVGWTVGWVAAALAVRSGFMVPLGVFVVGPVYGLVTGIPLARRLYHPLPQAQAERA